MGEEIGLATVYRVLNQFDDAHCDTSHFEGGKSVFELTQQHHHDHLICPDCGKVIEFSDESIEVRQRDIAKQHGIKLTNHSLYLYGHWKPVTVAKTKRCTTRNKPDRPPHAEAVFMPAVQRAKSPDQPGKIMS